MRTLHGLISVLILSCAYLFFAVSVQAASLKFDSGSKNAAIGDTFSVDAMIDAGSDQITSTDMWILYDPAIVEAQSASSSGYFPAVTTNITSGKIYIAGLITDPGTYKTGSGAVAKINFKALKNGTTTLTYDCRTDASNSSKVIKNATDPTNVINCGQNGTTVVTVGTGGPTSTPAPTMLYQQQTPASTLPRTGIMDELPKFMKMGGVLVVTGVILRLLLLL